MTPEEQVEAIRTLTYSKITHNGEHRWYIKTEEIEAIIGKKPDDPKCKCCNQTMYSD